MRNIFVTAGRLRHLRRRLSRESGYRRWPLQAPSIEHPVLTLYSEAVRSTLRVGRETKTNDSGVMPRAWISEGASRFAFCPRGIDSHENPIHPRAPVRGSAWRRAVSSFPELSFAEESRCRWNGSVGLPDLRHNRPSRFCIARNARYGARWGIGSLGRRHT